MIKPVPVVLRPCVLACWALAGWLLGAPGYAQSIDESRFVNLQAAYVYNIAKLVKWPNLETADHFLLCLSGHQQDALYQSLLTGVEKRRIQDKPIKVSQGGDLSGCHLVYLTGDAALASDTGQLNTPISDPLRDSRMLRIASPAVKDSPHSLVNLVLEEGRIALYINGTELSRSELTINPALLSIARPR